MSRNALRAVITVRQTPSAWMSQVHFNVTAKLATLEMEWIAQVGFK